MSSRLAMNVTAKFDHGSGSQSLRLRSSLAAGTALALALAWGASHAARGAVVDGVPSVSSCAALGIAYRDATATPNFGGPAGGGFVPSPTPIPAPPPTRAQPTQPMPPATTQGQAAAPAQPRTNPGTVLADRAPAPPDFDGRTVRVMPTTPGVAAAPPNATTRLFAAPVAPAPRDTERYPGATVNPIKRVAEAPVSTFSIDVDTASYANVRRFLNDGQLPPRDAVRVEELVNYFSYGYAKPDGLDRPFQPTVTVAPSPWAAGKEIVHIGLQGYEVPQKDAPPLNLVFLVDVSGSIDGPLLERFAREVGAILRRQEAALTLVIGDDQVRRVEQVDPDRGTARRFDLRDIEFHGGGGTDFTPLLEEADRHRPDIGVVLTDLEGPAHFQPRWPVIWAVPAAYSAAVPPFGRLLVID